MAAYRRVDGLVTCGLTACTPGSAPGPTLGNEYGRTLSLPLYQCTGKDEGIRTSKYESVKTLVGSQRVADGRHA